MEALLWPLFLSCALLGFVRPPTVSSLSLRDYYVNARNVRLERGHDATVPLYQEILQQNPGDITAATRIAASLHSPDRHDTACRVDSPEQIHQLRRLLQDSNYDNVHVQKLFGISPSNKLAFCAGPVYVTPAPAGSVVKQVEIARNDDKSNCSLQCLVSLFLLGLSVKLDVLHECILGGRDSVQLLQDLGLAFPCEFNSTLFVPYAHLFPMDVCNAGNLILATDLHPRVLSTTEVGSHQHGAVMYIGPDSLALVRNFPLSLISSSRGDDYDRILDLCTGSGVQALAALRRLNGSSSTTDTVPRALCIDINERALQFVKFNAALNGLEDQVETLQADLIAGTSTSTDKLNLVRQIKQSCRSLYPNSNDEANFDVILANPPFIPVPPGNTVIQQRYGLFSSGGPDGEDVLKAVVQLASKLLSTGGGLLAIVSEFMNPPNENGDNSLMRRLQEWWSESGPGGRGVMLTNEIPVDTATYSKRRADNEKELEIWTQHLAQLNVTHVSPGLLFMAANKSVSEMELQHVLVRKTEDGSIWTPSNRNAVEFTKQVVQKVLQNSGTSIS